MSKLQWNLSKIQLIDETNKYFINSTHFPRVDIMLHSRIRGEENKYATWRQFQNLDHSPPKFNNFTFFRATFKSRFQFPTVNSNSQWRCKDLVLINHVTVLKRNGKFSTKIWFFVGFLIFDQLQIRLVNRVQFSVESHQQIQKQHLQLCVQCKNM